MKENVNLKDEVEKLTQDLLKFTKGKETLDKLLGSKHRAGLDWPTNPPGPSRLTRDQ